MTLETALQTLRQSTADAKPGQEAGERAKARLADATLAIGDDLAVVDKGLRELTRTGVVPATDAAQHLLGAGGKRVRPLLVLLSASCFGETNDSIKSLAMVAELVHLATLLHDDVVDEGMERRGIPTARLKWGNALSVLSGDLLLVHALETAAKHDPSGFPSLLVTLRRLVDGEVIQLRGRTIFDPSEETYFQIVADKTASLFSWAGATGARMTGGDSFKFATFGLHTGTAFQLIDDLLDYEGKFEDTGKTLFADLIEGKLTLPLILAMKENPAIAHLVKDVRAGNNKQLADVVRAVLDTSAIELVRERARHETQLALRSIEEVPESVAKGLLVSVVTDLAARVA